MTVEAAVWNKNSSSWRDFVDSSTISVDVDTNHQVSFNVVSGSITLPMIAASASGNRWGVIASIGNDGVMEVGRYIDFHNSDDSAVDQAVRLETNGTTDSLTIDGSIISTVGVAREYTAQQNFNAGTLTDGATINWNLDTQQCASVTLGGNRTLAAPSNMKDGGTYILKIIQDGTGTRTLAFNSTYKFPGGSDPVLSTAANAIDLMTCYSDGTNMLCSVAKGFA